MAILGKTLGQDNRTSEVWEKVNSLDLPRKSKVLVRVKPVCKVTPLAFQGERQGPRSSNVGQRKKTGPKALDEGLGASFSQAASEVECSVRAAARTRRTPARHAATSHHQAWSFIASIRPSAPGAWTPWRPVADRSSAPTPSLFGGHTRATPSTPRLEPTASTPRGRAPGLQSREPAAPRHPAAPGFRACTPGGSLEPL